MRTSRMLRNLRAPVLGVALLPLAAVADQAERPPFDAADADGDGAISLEEATGAGVPESEARREDIDGDGKLTVADWKFVDLNSESGQSSGSGEAAD